MTDLKTHSGRGGRRKGAGRPRTNSKLYTFRAQEPMAKVIDKQKSKTKFIKECIENEIERRNHPRWGEIIPAESVRDMSLPYFDPGLVAGFPIPLDSDEKAQDIELLKMLCPHPESNYLIRVKGDSMIDAGVHSGDIVIVDKSRRNPGRQDIAVCELNGEYTLKRFVKRGGTGWLVPANPEFPEIQVTENDNFSVWGVVTAIIHVCAR